MASEPKINKAIAPPRESPPEPKKPRKPNFDLLTEEDKEKLRAEAKEHFDKLELARTEDAFIKAEMRRLEVEAHPEIEEPMELVDMSGLALYAAAGGSPGRPLPGLILNGKFYGADRIHEVKRSVAQVLREQIYRSQKHEAEIHSDPAEQAARAQRAISKAGAGFAAVSMTQNGPITTRF